MNRMIVAATLAAYVTVLSPMSFAEESPAFAAHFATLQNRAHNSGAEQGVANRHVTESQPAHTKVMAEPQSRNDS